MMSEVISPPREMLSVLASPIVILPPKVMLPSISALPERYKFEPEISPVTERSLPNEASPTKSKVPLRSVLFVINKFDPVISPDTFKPAEDRFVMVIAATVVPSKLPERSNAVDSPNLYKASSSVL